MDPEKTLTFCLGLQAEEMTMSLQGLVAPEDATVPAKEMETSTIKKVVKHHGNVDSKPAVSPKYCPGVNNKPGYLCVTGHCCGETGCCTYYYEVWWFWLLWTVLILFSCFCAYRHRRAKLRIQQQQRQREINLIAYNGASNYPSSMLDLSFLTSFKLPTYEEVAAQPSTPPPPCSTVFALQGDVMGGPSFSYPHSHHHHPCNPCPPYLGPGPSVLTSSQSSDNYTSCSCESCSVTSPSSTSFSVQVTDETYDSSHISTPSEAGGNFAEMARARSSRPSTPSPPPQSQPPPDLIPSTTPDVIPVWRRSSNGCEELSFSAPLSLPLHSHPTHPSHFPLSPLVLISSAPPGQVHPPLPQDLPSVPKSGDETSPYDLPLSLTPSPLTHPLHLTKVAVSMHGKNKDVQNQEKEEEEEGEDEEDEEDHFQHRRLTGDSGIEVCRCHVKREEQKLQDECLEDGNKDILRERERADRKRAEDNSQKIRPALQSPLDGQLPSPSCNPHSHGEVPLSAQTS
uniref:WW domain binding protein 1 n=1 Tax=Oryzias latipes TaxID=8090 RepID=A0A3P9LI41_ORYLA